jgi:hypothetical protein
MADQFERAGPEPCGNFVTKGKAEINRLRRCPVRGARDTGGLLITDSEDSE